MNKLHQFSSACLGALVVLFYLINVLVCTTIVFVVAILRLIPIRSWQDRCHLFMNTMPIYWETINECIQRISGKIEWDIQGTEALKQDSWYLLVCNHQSWADIVVLEKTFHRKTPVLKFFMKKELLWTLPIAGVAAWLLDFPFMERYTKKFLSKHPELKGKDMETTRKACEKFKYIPATVINFLEGTRFTVEKKNRQDSPYRHLLRPKAGGIAFALGAMSDYVHNILNVTIIYPSVEPSFWDFFCGRMKKIIVRVEVIPVSPEMLGDYESDRAYRTQFQSWCNQLWQKKDEILEEFK